MLTLYITQDNRSDLLKNQMTDEMWALVVIKYTDEDPYLDLDNQVKIIEISKIIEYLNTKNPSIKQQLNNAQKAAKRIYQNILKTGKIIANKETISTRKDTCKTCIYNRYSILGRKCSKCGCYLKLKITLVTEECPVNKW